jgi:peroxiredoxin
MAVNDVFVMNAWGKSANADKILMLADGNGDFTQAIGLELDASGFGMGLRSQRFALVARDGVVTQLFIEEPGEFDVSSAEHLLSSI